MKTFKITILLACLISLAGCLDNSTEPEPVIDYGGISDYYIANQTDIDLNVTFKIKGTGNDSTVTVPKDSTVKIFRGGGIGGSVPIGTFSKFSFYKLSDNNMKTPLLVIEPIVNDNWIVIKNTEEGDNSGNFKLPITEEDLN